MPQAPGDTMGKKDGVYSKCLSNQEKRKDGRCYPKKFPKSKTFYDYDNLSLKDLSAVLADIKETKKANRKSVFDNQEKTLFVATIILPKILATVKNVKNAPVPPEGYAKKRQKYLSVHRQSNYLL